MSVHQAFSIAALLGLTLVSCAAPPSEEAAATTPLTFRAPLSRAGRLIVSEGALRFIACGAQGDRLQEIRYGGLEGPGCDRLPPDGEVEARGNEPFWTMRVQGAAALIRTPDEPDGREYGNGSWNRLDAARWRHESRRGNGAGSESVVLELTEERCADSMSGARYPLRAVLLRDGMRMEGCALEGRAAAH